MSHSFVTTDGVRRYRVERDWAKLPGGMELGPISQLVVRRDGRVVVVQRVAPAVLVFGPDGELEESWHHPQLPSVHGVSLDAEDNLLVTSFDAHQVLRFDRTGRITLELGTFDGPHWAEPFNHPTDIAVAPDGEIYVTDGYGNARVHRFAADGRLIGSWGAPGVAPGEFCCPHGIWITADDRVVVLDRDNSRIQVFDREGKLQTIWSGFVKPMDIWGNAAGDLFVSDQTPRIVRLGADGTFKGAMRAFAVYPHGLWGDAEGNLFVAEQLPSGVAKYNALV
jgi:sugar lactone lactonase YvrE